MAELTPQSIKLPIRISYNMPEPGGSYPPHVIVLFPLTNQYLELSLEECRDMHRGFARFLAEVDAKAAGK